MNIAHIEFPVIGLSAPSKGVYYAFVARCEKEMRECPLHSYWSGMLKEQYFVDSTGRRFNAKSVRLIGLDTMRIREVGYGASILSAILSGLNVPVLLKFELTEDGTVDINFLKNTLEKCVISFPRYYTMTRSLETVLQKIRHARSISELTKVIS